MGLEHSGFLDATGQIDIVNRWTTFALEPKVLAAFVHGARRRVATVEELSINRRATMT